MPSREKFGVLCVALFTFSAFSFARERQPAATDPPLVNWSAPATYTPPASLSRIRGLGDIASPLPFIPVSPCRQYDIRPGTLADNTNLTIALSGAPCGIPSSASAVSVNITVFGISGAGGNGVFRVGIAANPPTAWINFPPTETQRANAGAVATDGSGNIVVKVNQGGGTIQLTVDVNGYYASAAANQGNTFTVINSGATTVPAILGQTNSTNFNATGVKGVASSPTGVTNGVWGDSVSSSDGATGVFGFAEGTSGVTTGVWGRSVSSSGDSRGVYGENLATTGRIYGVYGYEASPSFNSAGIRGVDSSGSPPLISTPAGVRGESNFESGVLGVSQNIGVAGYLVNSSGDVVSGGLLGDLSIGVYYLNGLAGTGTKSFVEPHPTDPSKAIRYVCLEGPEAGTYFRGTDQTSHGMAVIPVPESFRLVTDTEGLTVQLTPIGAPATMYVVSQDLNQIVVRSSRDVRFHYMVNGVRKAYPHWEAIQEDASFFVPASASDRLPSYLSEEERGRLIRNGTYNADGTVNLETAERVGWTKKWAEREARARAAALEARKAFEEGRR